MSREKRESKRIYRGTVEKTKLPQKKKWYRTTDT